MTPGLGCDPEDGDLVQSPPPVEVPDDVAEAGLLDTHRYSLDQIEEAYEVFSNLRDGVLKVAITP